jgi:regulatory protein
LAGRPHFRRQLEEKLRRRGHEAEEVTAALDRLAAQGYLNDDQLARDFAAQRGTGKGARRVRAELARRGADEGAIAAALATLPDDDSEATLLAARQWRARRQPNPAGLARHLERKGFSHRGILRALRELGAAEE